MKASLFDLSLAACSLQRSMRDRQGFVRTSASEVPPFSGQFPVRVMA